MAPLLLACRLQLDRLGHDQVADPHRAPGVQGQSRVGSQGGRAEGQGGARAESEGGGRQAGPFGHVFRLPGSSSPRRRSFRRRVLGLCSDLRRSGLPPPGSGVLFLGARGPGGVAETAGRCRRGAGAPWLLRGADHLVVGPRWNRELRQHRCENVLLSPESWATLLDGWQMHVLGASQRKEKACGHGGLAVSEIRARGPRAGCRGRSC
mmetsp:Transcript_104267/g.264771  ORF Transcript_104267/g.264771 Transcript_104267/m.264771 type:complete len:208 (-) Transcript_104267:311-934(-)